MISCQIYCNASLFQNAGTRRSLDAYTSNCWCTHFEVGEREREVESIVEEYAKIKSREKSDRPFIVGREKKHGF
jgi:hypothetical protein